MANFDQNRMNAGATVRGDASIDQGLRSYMLSVYNYMAGGLAITGIVAYLVAQMAVATSPETVAVTLGNGVPLTSFGAALYLSALRWVVMLAPLGLVFFLSARISKLSISASQTTVWVFGPYGSVPVEHFPHLHRGFDHPDLLCHLHRFWWPKSLWLHHKT